MITSTIKIKNTTDERSREGSAGYVELKCIGKIFPYRKNSGMEICDARGFHALKDISIKVPEGSILGIIGRNGAGKTTLLSIIAGTLSPTDGERLVEGKAIGLFNLGIGFQDALTGKDNIFLNGALLGATKKELSEKISSIIEFSELGDFINMPLGTYSRGMRLRLAFSIIANIDFDILLVDEVLAVGDIPFQAKCYEKFIDFKKQGKTLVMTGQDMDVMSRFCDKIAVLNHGSLVFEGKPQEAIDRYYHLLNSENFFVGPVKKDVKLIENTKKWSDNPDDWGKKYGTKEVVIESVSFINKLGRRCKSIKSQESLKIKVYFNVESKVKNIHFGIAIFRKDGVYCYGPNTEFDKYFVPELNSGYRGYFILNFRRFFLAPGEYRFSVAIWDKDEHIPFDYHNAYYNFIISGRNPDKSLLEMPCKHALAGLLDRIFVRNKITSCRIDLTLLADYWGKKLDSDKAIIEKISILDPGNNTKECFISGETMKIAVCFKQLILPLDNSFLWLGIYREDLVYCQGVIVPLIRKNDAELLFPKLPLLPGGYKVSVGIWSNADDKFLSYHHGVYSFHMVSHRRDHGTAYMEHQWRLGR